MLHVVLYNGGAKTSKTTMSEGARDYLAARGMDVRYGDAGSHYRKITAATLGWLGIGEHVNEVPSEEALAAHVAKVLAAREADDTGRDWGNLDSEAINTVIAHVANRPAVKADALQWYERTADSARREGAEALVINGRAPREVLAGWFGRTGLRPAAELYVECEPAEAARRTLLADGRPLTPENLAARQRKIEARRLADSQHAEYPCVEPAQAVHFRPYNTAQDELERAARQAVRLSYERAPEAEAPLPIRFNNTHMPIDIMLAGGAAVVDAALSQNLAHQL